ncbi:hypothetical protein RhiirA5_436146 [Rhizophagus irregularis]|uniref:Uncharacterized protein n=1 Tax=Rhizophagus irregularis TaxID=588596 RepID=A0A2N0NMC4_9GLOM|nr:hypothetical protein RhiirA5_436146 [Rhizophagus irregularis]
MESCIYQITVFNNSHDYNKNKSREHIKGIKKQDLRKRPLAHQRIAYKWVLTIQTEEGMFDLKKRKILKHNEQWSIMRVVKAFT